MANAGANAMGDGCLGGLVGAVLGILIGGSVGPMTVHHNDPQASAPFAKEIDACGGFFGMLFGAGIGGIIGGIGGSVLGAGLAARGSSTPAEELPPTKDVGSDVVPEQPPESSAAELARLKKRVAELERENRKENPGKENDSGPA